MNDKCSKMLGALNRRLGFSALLLLNRRKGLNASLSLKPRRLFISLHEQRNEAKKFAVCTFLPTPALFSAKQKELALLKQLFVFHAPKSISASRQKSEAGPYRFFRNIASLVGCGCFRDPSLHFVSLWMTKKEIGCAMKSRSFTTLCFIIRYAHRKSLLIF